MKKRFGQLIVFVMVFWQLVLGVANADLIAYWPLDEGVDEAILDLSGNGHNGVIKGRASFGKGRFGQAIYLNGINQAVSIPHSIRLMPTEQISIAGWILPYDVSSTAEIYRKEDRVGRHMFQLRCDNGENVLVFGLTLKEGYEELVVLVKGSDLMDGEWHFVVATYDGTYKKIYKDGMEIGRAAAKGRISTDTKEIAGSVFIGSHSGKGEWFNGAIDEVSLFDHALSDDEIAKLYTQSITLALEPVLQKMVSGEVRDVEAMIKELGPQEAVSLLENKVNESVQHIVNATNDVGIRHKRLCAELHCLLAKAKEAGGASKDEVADIYIRSVESGWLSLASQGAGLLWLHENMETEQYEGVVASLIQKNGVFLGGVAVEAERMLRVQKPELAIRFLEGNLSVCQRWRKKHPFDNDDLAVEDRLPEIYFLLGKAREAVGATTKDIASAYGNTFKSTGLRLLSEKAIALIWLLENNCNDEYTSSIESFAQVANVEKDYSKLVRKVCKHFESKKNWSSFKRFLDTLFAKSKNQDWTGFVESFLSDEHNRWGKKYFAYLDSKPKLRFRRDWMAADEYLATEKFEKAIELYRSLVGRCDSEAEKGAIKFQLCKSLFLWGTYSEATSELTSFIADNRASSGSRLKEAMMMKGRAHIQLGEMDKAIDILLGLMVEYPDAKEMPETHFFVGYAYMLQGDFEAAKEAFSLVVKGYPASFHAGKARLLLMRIKNMTD